MRGMIHGEARHLVVKIETFPQNLTPDSTQCLVDLVSQMGLFQNRKLLSSTITFPIKKQPCVPQSPCFIFCSCEKPPPPPPPPPHEHRLLTTGMTVTACVLGVFFFLGIVCIVMRFRYLRRIESRRRNLPVLFLTRDDFTDEGRGPAVDHPIWLINFVGLQQSVIDSIAVCEYKRGEGLVDGTECSVCLGEFEDGEDLRLLPKCSHAFHLPCIDTWLRSHKNCPLCRAPVVCATETSLEETRLEGSGNGLDHQQVGEGDDGSGIDGIGDMGFGSATPIAGQIGKNCDSRAHSDLGQNRKVGFEGEVQAMRRSVSMDLSLASMIYDAVANVSSDGAELRELKSSSFKNPCKHVGTGSSSSSGSGNSSTSSSLCRLMKSASLGCVVQKGPVSMKRSCSSRIRTSQDSIKEHESSSSL